MLGKLEAKIDLEKDVIKALKNQGFNIREETKKAIRDLLFEIAEDWVIRGIEPNIEFE